MSWRGTQPTGDSPMKALVLVHARGKSSADCQPHSSPRVLPSTGFTVGSIEMMNHKNRFASPSVRMAAKAILLAATFTLLAGCVETPPPRPYRTYREVPPPAPRPNTEVYAYPLQGQSPEQTDRDRYDCHEWAVKQTTFDPSAPGVPPHDQVRVASASGPRS